MEGEECNNNANSKEGSVIEDGLVFFDDSPKKAEKRKSVLEEFVLVPKAARLLLDNEQCDVFGNFVASELKNLKVGYLQKKLKRKIQEIILEISLEEETLDNDGENKYSGEKKSGKGTGKSSNGHSNTSTIIVDENTMTTFEPKHPKKSRIWEYFKNIQVGLALCDLCQKTIKCTGGSTSALRNHVKIKHGISAY